MVRDELASVFGELSLGGELRPCGGTLAVAEGGNVSVYFEVLSYAGTLTVSVVVDPEHFAELDLLARLLEGELLTAEHATTREALQAQLALLGLEATDEALLGGVVDQGLVVHHRVHRTWRGSDRAETLDIFVEAVEEVRAEIAAESAENVEVPMRLAGMPAAERRAPGFRVVAYPAARGSAASYYPETNVLVPLDSVAAVSNTPTSKGVIVRLEPVAEAG